MNKNTKIKVIFTGGTIGSIIKDGWISTDEQTGWLLLSKYREYTKDTQTDFVTETPYTVLSENLSAKELNLLAKCVNKNLEEDYDGIIVTHGSDTLQYTAAALSFMFDNAKIPVVLVSSNYPLEMERANGTENFTAAVEFIKAEAGKGVFVSYKNQEDDRVCIHRGTRVTAHREASDDVYSIDRKPYAFFDGKIKINEKYTPGETGVATGVTEFSDYPDILVIESRPGDRYSYSLENCKAVILAPYHSATLNTQNQRLVEFCESAYKNNIPVFLVNANGGTGYESEQDFDKMHLEILPLCSKIAVYVKCWMAISLDRDIREFVNTPVSQEFCGGDI